MENTDINSAIEEKVAAYQAAELAKVQEKIERKAAALREKLAKEIEARRQAEQAQAEAMEKLAALPQQCGYSNAADLIRALSVLLTDKERAKLFAAPKKQACKTRRGPGNGLSDEERAEIAKLRAENVPTTEIAKKFNISINTVYSIKKAEAAQ